MMLTGVIIWLYMVAAVAMAIRFDLPVEVEK